MIPDKMPGHIGTIGGTLLSISVTLNGGDIVKSCILGALGTIISYTITKLLKAVFERKAT
jgi:hypothetical protein